MGVPSSLALPSTRSASSLRAHFAAFLTADDDWIANHQGATIALLMLAVLIIPGVIEWMI